MSHVKIEVRNHKGRVVSESVIPHGTEWFFPRQFRFERGDLYIKDSERPIMRRWGRTVPPGGRLEIGVTE